MASAYGIALVPDSRFACASRSLKPKPSVQQQITKRVPQQLLLEAGRLDDAKRVLAHVLETNPNDNAAIFISGHDSAVAEKGLWCSDREFPPHPGHQNPNRSGSHFRTRARVFLQGDYENAERNFRFARAGIAAPEVKAQYPRSISRGDPAAKAHWSYDVGQLRSRRTHQRKWCTRASTRSTLYGIPFTLSDNARSAEKTSVGEVTPSRSVARVGRRFSPTI